jgi:threonine 3-dehydrogenase
MPEMMKALIKAKSEVGIWMGEVPVPEIEPDEVLIKIQRASICGTDMHIYKWDDWAKATVPVPMVTGHEYGGEVVDVGSTVKRVKIGDRVSGEGHVVGNRSRNARSGRFHLDPDTKGIGVNMPGAFAEYLRLPEFNVIPLAPDFDLEIAAILDPLGNAVHTALSFDLVGEDVLITGAGPIGVMSAAVAMKAGARRVVITDINEWRLNFAKKIVPTVNTVNVTKQDLQEKMTEFGLKEGFDVGFEMSGAEPAFSQMVDTMIMGGNIAMLGLPPKPFAADFGKIVLKALTIRGIYGRQMYDTWYKMLAMLDSGLDMSGLITDRFPASEYQAAFDLMLTGEAGKVILDWENV